MSDRILHILQNIFHLQKFRCFQESAIKSICKGNNTLIIMSTGGGKSLCYQLPSFIIKGTAIVISPLISLMEDQIAQLKYLDIQAACLHSQQSALQQKNIKTALFKNQIKLLYISPETLFSNKTQKLMAKINISFFAIDEAHCISQWGADFRPAYLKLNKLPYFYPNIPRIALTGSANKQMRNDLITALSLNTSSIFIDTFNRPNIFYQVEQKYNARQQLLAFIKKKHLHNTGIIYCLTKKKVASVIRWLKTEKYNTVSYHGDMSAEERRKNQTCFLKNEAIIMVATSAFGMGVHKNNIRFVVHIDLPKSIEAYYQESGRAGRDGKPADAWMFYSIEDVIILNKLQYFTTTDESQRTISKKQRGQLLKWCQSPVCRRQTLLSYFDEVFIENCNHCDRCLYPVHQQKMTIEAKKIIICIYSTGQKFNTTHIINILIGVANNQIQQQGHDRIKSFADGTSYSKKIWLTLLIQMLAMELIDINSNNNALVLRPTCKKILHNKQDFFIYF